MTAADRALVTMSALATLLGLPLVLLWARRPSPRTACPITLSTSGPSSEVDPIDPYPHGLLTRGRTRAAGGHARAGTVDA